MLKLRLSPTYINLIDLLFKMGGIVQEVEGYSSTFNNGAYKRVKRQDKSAMIRQSFGTMDLRFLDGLNNAETLVAVKIMRELKEYNGLWYCGEDFKNSSSNRAVLKTFISNNILIKTETTNIYFVSPYYIRRGDIMSVITTTASLLQDISKVNVSLIVNKKPIDEFSAKINPLIGS